MKTRIGFVSNSSSSSFVVGFPKYPTSPVHLMEMMFPSGDTEIDCKYYNSMTPIDIANAIWSDIKKENLLNKRKALLVIKEGWFPGHPNLLSYRWNYKSKSDKIAEEFRSETGRDITDEPEKSPIRKFYQKTKEEEWKHDLELVNVAAKGLLEGFWPRVKGMKVFRFEYGDHDGQGFLEHGNVFRNLPYIKISKH